MSTQISRRAFVQDAGLAALGVTALAAIAGPAAAGPAAPAPDAPDGAPAGGMPPMMGNGPVEDPAWREAPAEPAESEVVETYANATRFDAPDMGFAAANHESELFLG